MNAGRFGLAFISDGLTDSHEAHKPMRINASEMLYMTGLRSSAFALYAIEHLRGKGVSRYATCHDVWLS